MLPCYPAAHLGAVAVGNRSTDLTATTTLTSSKLKTCLRWCADIALVIVATGLTLVFFLFLRDTKTDQPYMPPKAPTVGVIGIKERPLMLTTELPGRVVAREISEVRPQVSGVIRDRIFVEGAQVKKGQLLYVIEDAAFRAAVVAAEAKLAEATAMIRLTRSRAERYATLLSHDAISRQDADEARNAYQLARANVRTQRGVLDAALVNLELTRIRAPISGKIGPSFVSLGAHVQSGQQEALALINKTDEVFVEVRQSSGKLLSLRESFETEHLHLREDANSAQVRLILPNGREYNQTGTLSFSEAVMDFTTCSVTLRVLFPNPDAKLHPGMAVRAIVTEGIKTRAILVPQRGITLDVRGNGVALIVDKDNLVVGRSVIIDRAVEKQWLITAGLSENDRLIVDGINSIKLGQKVRPFAPRQPIVAASDKRER
jgi:membrane fusion protein (multidrug efflux system)